jgi:ketosteroid isomerase-like protein
MNQNSAVVQVLTDYYAAFSTLDIESFLPYFHEPSLLIGPQGMFAAPTYAVLTTAFAPLIESFRARGFGRSELSVRDVKRLSATTALVTGIAIRYKTDGQEMDRAGVTYVLDKKDTGWKIAVLILHDAEENGTAA